MKTFSLIYLALFAVIVEESVSQQPIRSFGYGGMGFPGGGLSGGGLGNGLGLSGLGSGMGVNNLGGGGLGAGGLGSGLGGGYNHAAQIGPTIAALASLGVGNPGHGGMGGLGGGPMGMMPGGNAAMLQGGGYGLSPQSFPRFQGGAGGYRPGGGLLG